MENNFDGADPEEHHDMILVKKGLVVGVIRASINFVLKYHADSDAIFIREKMNRSEVPDIGYEWVSGTVFTGPAPVEDENTGG